MRTSVATLLAITLIAIAAGCNRKSPSAGPESQVVLYTSVDEPYARPLVERFQKQTGIHVTLLTDAEASKSVGLAERLRAERDHPRCDVWWSNECFLTINLADAGVLAPYDSPSAANIPDRYKDREHRWAGSVLRVRVLVSAPQKAGNGSAPVAHLRDLLRPELKNQVAIARPTAGTTGGHVAALYVLWGDVKADTFFRGLHNQGVSLLGGNSIVAESVARADLRAGLCDNDDAADASKEIGKLNTALPDQGEGEDGTLAMPCTVALAAGSPHPDAAKKLMDYLLSADVDRALVDEKFAWCSTRDVPGHGRFMAVDYHAVAARMPSAIRRATALLEGRD